MHRKNHSSLFHSLSRKKKTKTTPRRQPHKIAKDLGFGTVQITLTDFFLLSWERKAAELAHGTGVLPPSRCSPRAPQRATAVYPTVCEHTLPLPRRGAGAARGARRADAQDARRPAETEAEEGGPAAASKKAPPPRAPAQRHRSYRSGTGFRGNKWPYARRILTKLGALTPGGKPRARCGYVDVSLRKVIEKKPQGVLSPADKYGNYTGKSKGEKKSPIFSVCYLKRKSFLLSPGDFCFFVLGIGNQTLHNTENTTWMKYQELLKKLQEL